MSKLRDCYDKLRPILGENMEPYESVELVEKYRQYWKPDNVKVLLLAESHVFTTDLDRLIKIPNISHLNDYPKEYAKFVYCLGYGERNLTNNSSHPKRDGTPQFWKIFYSCNNYVEGNSDFSPISSKTDYAQRIQNKIRLLESLKKNGVWLVDSCIVALYDNGKKPSYNKMSSAIHASWNGYTKNVVKGSNPEHVIIIGKGVANIIENDVGKLLGSKYSIIAQPNAHLSAIEHLDNYKEYYRLCVQ
jgi:hypothetical protein